MSRHVHMPPPIVYTAVPKKVDETRRRPGLLGLRKIEKKGEDTDEADTVAGADGFAASITGPTRRRSFDPIPDDLLEKRNRPGTSLLSDESLKTMLLIQEKKTS